MKQENIYCSNVMIYDNIHVGKINEEEVSELMKESIKMLTFSHPNVMGLLGVCVDAGPTPYVILPFMSGGSLEDYLKANRKTLVLAKEEEMDEDDVSNNILACDMHVCKALQTSHYIRMVVINILGSVQLNSF